MQLSVSNQFTRIGLDGDDSSVNSWEILSASSCCSQSLCELFCDYFNAIKATLIANTVLISTILIKIWLIQHWLDCSVQYRPFQYISKWEHQQWETPTENVPTSYLKWLHPLLIDDMCSSLGYLLVRRLFSWIENGCRDPRKACDDDDDDDFYAGGRWKNLIKIDIGIIKAFSRHTAIPNTINM